MPSGQPFYLQQATAAATQASAQSVAVYNQTHDAGCVLGRSTNYTSVISDDMEFLRDPERSWDERLRLIEQAKSFIVNTVFYIEPDEMGIQYLDALIRAQERGVQVVLAMDQALQKICLYTLNTRAQRRAFQQRVGRLLAAGAVVSYYGKLSQQLRLPGVGMHYKSLIVDGEVAVVGGRNISRIYYAKDQWQDLEAKLTGGIIGQVSQEALSAVAMSQMTDSNSYSQDEQRQRFEKIKEGVMARVGERVSQDERKNLERLVSGRGVNSIHLVTYNPINEDGSIKSEDVPNPVTLSLKAAFDSAQKEIWASTNFFNATPVLREALIAAAKRGVKVRVMTTGPDVGITAMYTEMPYIAAVQGYDELLAAGIEIYETQDIQEHGKMYVVDDRVAGFGSYNMELTAHNRLFECLIFTHKAEAIREIRRFISGTIDRHCKRYNPETFRPEQRYPLWKRFLARTFSPLYV